MAANNYDNKVIHPLKLLSVAVAGAVFIFLIDHVYRAAVVRESNRQLTEAASTMQRHLSVELNNLILVTTDLRAFLVTQPDPPDSHSFAHFGATLRAHYPALDALVYVGPDRIIREIYPLAGNERAIGLDLRTRPAAPYIERAINERKIIVDPPHTMTNGRLAVIARLPVFRGEKFLGIAQAILHVPDVVQNELGDLSSKFAIQLWDANGKQFWGKEQLEGATQSRELVVGNTSWTLLVAPAKAPETSGLALVRIWGVGGLVLLLTVRSMHREYRLRLVLTDEVTNTTRELRERNRELERQISQRLEAEAQVYRSEQRLREAQRIARVGSWEWDFVDNRLHWSDELYHIFGLNAQEFEPTVEGFDSRVHPEDLAKVKRLVAESLETGNPCEQEHRIILPDGEIRYVRGVGVLECSADGKPLRMAGTLQDITAQKHAVMALEESERKYRAVLENANDGIIITSTEGKVLDANRRLQAMLGYSREELLNMHVSQIHPPEDLELLHTAFVTVREHGFSLFEQQILRKDGTTAPVEVAGALITFDNQQQVAFGVFRDIRERKRIEAELQQHRNHLEHLVEQRTAELVALNEELEAFSYSVSHDLRAPLRAIKGFSTALWEDYVPQLDVTGRDYLGRIKTATERMGRLIDDMLRLSRTIRAEMHWDSVSLSTVVSELLLEMNAADPERKVRFVVAKGVISKGDLTLIRSLLQNLLTNAWKFSRNRSDAVIEFGVTTHAGKPAYFVCDNGIGFDMSHVHDLFKPFYRLHDDADYEGNGIGLATVQRIVHRHGGQVWAESEPGHGATFFFTLCPE